MKRVLFTTALAVAASLASVSSLFAQRTAPQQPAPRSSCSKPVVMSGMLTSRAYASWSGLPSPDGFTLELLVIWRGEENWYRTGGSGGRGRQSPCRGPEDLGATDQTVVVGMKEFSYHIDRTTRTIETLGSAYSLDDVNVIVVDDADSANGTPRIVAALRIDPQLVGAIGVVHKAFATLPALSRWTRD